MTKPPVILIPGMWSVPAALDTLAGGFRGQGYEVTVVQLPWHLPKAEMTDEHKRQLAATGIEAYLDAVIQAVNKVAAPPLVVGHSMGGLLAQMVAARAPCAGVILFSSAAPAGINPWSWHALRTFGHNLFRFPLWKTCTDLRLENIRYGIANTQSEAVQEEIHALATWESGRVSVQIGFAFLFPDSPVRVDERAVQCPMLIIGGGRDRITPIRIQRALARKYSAQATLYELDDACHWTVGGCFFPTIAARMFDWIGQVVLANGIDGSLQAPDTGQNARLVNAIRAPTTAPASTSDG